ncbi:MAG TPA: cupin domain-containing protein [Candidatus Obscuribacterales bacterium]
MKTAKVPAEKLIALLDLKPLPNEGGYFKETYRSQDILPANCLSNRYGEDKNASTCILYLITEQSFSALHKLKSDEIYHFYLGDPVELVAMHPDGQLKISVLGTDLANGAAPQAVIEAGCWQGSRLAQGGQYALMGCTVAPGFDFSDYEDGDRNGLIDLFPQHREIIIRYTRENRDDY